VQHPFVRRKGVADYLQRWQQGMTYPDKILWHADWVSDLLVRNGIPQGRLQRLSLPPLYGSAPYQHRSCERSTRRFVYLGRLIDIKGVHVLAEALRLIPKTEAIEVQVFGAKGPDDYLRRIGELCQDDPRIHLKPPITAAQVPEVLASADALIVPSLIPETGPYTVLEALWAGTPIVGSDRGGIRELLTRWGGGVLFETGNTGELAKILTGYDFESLRRDPSSFRSDWAAAFNRELDEISSLKSPESATNNVRKTAGRG
jgi:glycosyltransferase involved in cell wall biosynthesis